MNKKEKQTLAKDIAQMVLQGLKNPEKGDPSERELVSCSEAAEILGYTPAYMRRVKNQYPHVKHGDNPQGKLMFYKDELVKTFAKKENK